MCYQKILETAPKFDDQEILTKLDFWMGVGGDDPEAPEPQKYCRDWNNVNRALGKYAGQVTPIAILGVDVISKGIISKLTQFEGKHNYSHEVYSKMKNTFI